MKAPSEAAKAYAGALATVCGVVAATLVDSAIGRGAAIVGSAIGAWLAIYKTSNTERVTTGPGVTPVVKDVLNGAGQTIGAVTVDTGAAVSGVVAGTTGNLGKVLDATLGLVLPTGERRQ